MWIFLVIPLLAACRGPLSSLDAVGPAADSIATLWWSMLAGAAVLFALVIGLFWWAYRRPGYATNSSPRTWLLHVGVVMPTIVLTVLAGAAFALGQRLIAQPHAALVHVDAIARRFVWEFRYPQIAPERAYSVLHIPAGQTVEVRVISHDVIHSFWAPRLAGKIDAIPGHVNRVQLLAEHAGEYEGVCAEFCGVGHAHMRFRVIAHEAERYRSAVMEAAQ